MNRLCISIATVTLVCVVLLTLAWRAASPGIAAQQLNAERNALDAVLPTVAHDNDLLAARFALDPARHDFAQIELLGLNTSATGYRASLQGQPSGIIIPAMTRGFSDDITLLIGIDTDGAITGVRITQHHETRGLGDGIDEEVSPWILGFDNRSLENTPQVLWRVKKDGGDFDQFVGATITPRAVVTAIHNALLFFESNRDTLLVDPTGSEP